MASASHDLFAAIDAGDVDRVGAMLDADPSLAMARDEGSVSALLRARYRLDRALAEAVKARVAALDVHEAATFGDLDRRRPWTCSLRPERTPTPCSGAGGRRCSAAHNGDARTVELLLAHGADQAALDDVGRSVADMAAESGDDATIAAIARSQR